MGLKLFTTTAIAFAIWIGYSWIDRFDPVMVRGKRVLVTGASKGIGEKLAYQYASMGAKVMVTARNEEALKKVVSRCKEISGKSHQYYVTGDMSRLEDTEKVILAVKEILGGLDILVLNHAGPFELGWWQGKMNLTSFDYKTTVNYRSYIHLTAHALPMLKESQGSSIVVVSSTLAITGFSVNSEYTASKFALRGFFQSLGEQFEITGQQTSVTTCYLGLINTETSVNTLGTESVLGKNFTADYEGYLIFADPTSTALAMVKAGALREETMFYPYPNKILEVPGLQWVFRYIAKVVYRNAWEKKRDFGG